MNNIALAKEIDLRVTENESFRGRKVNFEKVRAYWDLNKNCTALAQIVPHIKHMDAIPPARDHRHAIVAMDIDPTCALPENVSVLLQQARRMADDVSVFSIGRLHRISFIIMNVWED